MRRFPLRALLFVAWLVSLCIVPAVGVVERANWRRAGYPEGGMSSASWFWPLVVTSLATIAWGFAVGRLEVVDAWRYLGLSVLVGPLVMLIAEGIGQAVEPSGGEGSVEGLFLAWLILCAGIGVLVGLGAVVGLASRRWMAPKPR